MNTNDFAAGSVFGGFNFSAGAGAFVIGGSAVNLSGNIISSSAATQTINLDLALQTSATTRVNAGGALVLGGAISGGFGVIKTGTGTLTLTNAGNSFAATVVSGGVLSLGTTGLLSASSNLTLGNGEFSIAGGGAAARAVGVGALMLNVGRDAITLSADAAQAATLTLASLVSRAPGATTLFRGTALGTAAPNTAGAPNLLFTTAPTAVTGVTTGANNVFAATGTGTLGTTQAAVLRGSIVDVSASGGGGAFATYDPVKGRARTRRGGAGGDLQFGGRGR